jgi:carbon-monoxide dehydrogenase large subunit
VKWVETRRENLAAATHAREARADVEAAADASGVLLALRARVVSDAGAYHVFPLTQALEPLGAASILPARTAHPLCLGGLRGRDQQAATGPPTAAWG